MVAKSNPREATFFASSSSVSSKAINTPGSWYLVAPRTRNSAAKRVLPQPAPPQTSVGRSFGIPPPVIASRPWIPVGAFSNANPGGRHFRLECMINHFRYSLICSPPLVVGGEHYFKQFLRRLLRERNKKRAGKKINFEVE